MRILIVDDSEIARTGLKVLLRGCPGYDVCGEAQGGKQGVLKAIELRPDLVILDYSMPGMDGLQTAQEIYKALPATEIFLCTVFPSRELEKEAGKYGIRHVISKAEMSKALMTLLDAMGRDGSQAPS